MNQKSIAAEIQTHLSKSHALDGTQPSPELETFLKDLKSGSLRIVKHSPKSKAKPRSTKSIPKKDAAAMAQTISDLSAKLQAAFSSDESFERTVQVVESSGLSKENVIELYNTVFGANKTFPKSVTKQALFNAIRKDRISRVRAAS